MNFREDEELGNTQRGPKDSPPHQSYYQRKKARLARQQTGDYLYSSGNSHKRVQTRAMEETLMTPGNSEGNYSGVKQGPKHSDTDLGFI